MFKKIHRMFTIKEKLIQDSKNEFIIQVDKNNKMIGKISKYDAHTCKVINQGIIHRAFSLFIFNNNKILLQQRSEHKATFANLWSNTCCSHPLFLEEELDERDYLGVKRAAQRRMKYELNLEENSINNFKVIDSHLYKAIDVNNLGEYECKIKRRSFNHSRNELHQRN